MRYTRHLLLRVSAALALAAGTLSILGLLPGDPGWG